MESFSDQQQKIKNSQNSFSINYIFYKIKHLYLLILRYLKLQLLYCINFCLISISKQPKILIGPEKLCNQTDF